MKLTYLLALLVLPLGMNQAFGAANEDSQHVTGVTLHAGQASLSGELAKSGSSTWGINVLLLTPRQGAEKGEAIGGIRGLWLIDFQNTSVTVKDDAKFPFTPGKTAYLSETSLVPTICAMAHYPVQPCLGIGWAQVTVRDDKNEENYGTYRGDLRFGKFLTEGLVYGAETHYYSIRQKYAGESSSFAVMSYEADLGWQW